jgi:hypothetical protein
VAVDRQPAHEVQLVEAPETLRIEQPLAPPLLDLLRRSAYQRRELFERYWSVNGHRTAVRPPYPGLCARRRSTIPHFKRWT